MNRWPVLLLTLAAFALRAWRLDGQSLWYDEGISVALAGRDLLTIARSAAADIHPPLYYFLLHFWVPLAGITEYAARWPSVVCGTLMVPLVCQLGRRLGGRLPAILAGLFVAVNPILVYYSQEARMYILVAALGTASAYLALRIVQGARPPLWLWAAYAAVAALTTYSHYYGLAVIAALNLWALIALLPPTHRRRLLAWLTANAVVGIGFLPWVGISWEQLRGWPAISQPLTAQALAGKVFVAFSFGFAPPAEAWPGQVLLAVLAGVLVAVAAAIIAGRGRPLAEAERVGANLVFAPDPGACPHPILHPMTRERGEGPILHPMTRERGEGPSPLPEGEGVDGVYGLAVWQALLLPVLWAAVPVLVLYVGSLQRPMYNPKFLLVSVPAYLLLLALGADAWLRLAVAAVATLTRGRTCRLLNTAIVAVLALVLAASVGGPAAGALLVQQTDPRLARDDYRGIARHIEASWREGDAILLNAPGQVELFAYYHPDLSAVYPMPPRRPPDEAEAVAALRQMADAHHRIWAVFWASQQADPQAIVERWLDANAYKSLSRWYGGVRLALYTLPGTDAAATRPLGIQLGGGVTLVSYSLEGEVVQPGDVIGVSLVWQAAQPMSTRYKVFVQLLDGQEYLWGQHDSEPAGGSRPTVSWRPGEPVADRHGLAVPLGTPPGPYELIVGVYVPNTGRRLEVPADPVHNRVSLGSVAVERPAVPPAPDMLSLRYRLGLDLGPDLRLLGYDAFRSGSDSPELKAGEGVLLSLYWEARRAPAADYELEVGLRNGAGQEIARSAGGPGGAEYPTGRWQPGEVVRSQHRLEALAPGEYTISIILWHVGSNSSVNNAGSNSPASYSPTSYGAGANDIGKLVVR